MRRLTKQEMWGMHIQKAPNNSYLADIDRFRLEVEGIEQAGTEGCWLWLGRKTGRGYPMFWDARIDEWVTAARWAYDYLREPVPPNQRVRRTCGNRACVSPFHAVLGFNKDAFRS